MVTFGEKAKIKKAGNLNWGRSYVITTVNFVEQLPIWKRQNTVQCTHPPGNFPNPRNKIPEKTKLFLALVPGFF